MQNTSDSDPRLLIVGSMAFDDLELPSGHFRNVIGGAATYAAYSASLFSPVCVVAVVGEDFPDAVLQDLSERGIDLSGVERAQGKTFRWSGRYAENLASRTTLDTQLNVFANFSPRLPEAYRSTRFVLLGNIQPELQLQVLEQASAPEFVAADTMNFWISSEPDKLEQVLRQIDLLVVNDEEVRQLAQDHSIKRAARAVLAMGPRGVVVKRGEAGAMLFDEHGIFFTPSYPLEAEVDPTGAGDSFAGALLGYLASQPAIDPKTLREALMIAATVASFSVEEVGTRGVAQLRRGQVAQRLQELRSLVHFSP